MKRAYVSRRSVKSCRTSALTGIGDYARTSSRSIPPPTQSRVPLVRAELRAHDEACRLHEVGDRNRLQQIADDTGDDRIRAGARRLRDVGNAEHRRGAFFTDDVDAIETRRPQHREILILQTQTRDASDVRGHALPHRRRELTERDEIREHETTAGAEHAERLTKDRRL